MMPAGKFLFVIGLVVMTIGAILTWAPGLLNWFGKLPGDVRIEKSGSEFYFPIVTMLLLSIVLTIIANLFFKR